MNKESNSSTEKTIRVCVDLPESLIDRFDELKEQWGLQRRGAVLERLLETLFEEDEDNPNS